jgi:hypothetical protein
VDTSDKCLVHLPSCCCTELSKACNYQWDLWLGVSSGSSGPGPPRGHLLLPTFFCRTYFISPWMQGDPPSTPSTPVVVDAGPAASTPQGPPSTSPPSVVVTARPTASSPQGARRRRLQLRWWPLPNLPTATPRGPTIDISNSGGGRYRTCRQHPPGGPPSTSPTLVVATAGLPTATPRGPAIDVSNSGGGHCRTYRQHPQGPAIDVSNFGGGCYRKSQQQPPGGSAIDVSNSSGGRCRTYQQHPPGARHRCFAKLGTCHQNFSGNTYQGGTAVNITTISKQLGGKMEARVLAKKNSGPCGAKNPGIIIPLQRLSPNQQTAVLHYQLLE